MAMRKLLVVIASFLLLPATWFAQSLPAAEGRGPSIWVGGEFSTFNPDWGCADSSPFTCWNSQLLGFAPFVDVNNLLLHRVGVEGEFRILHWRGPKGLTESSYLAGPRIEFFRFRNRLNLGAKFGVGSANINVPNHGPGSGNHLAFAPGFLAEFRASRRLKMRAEYEYQIWPNFDGGVASGTGACCGLTPNGFSLGFSYEVFR